MIKVNVFFLFRQYPPRIVPPDFVEEEMLRIADILLVIMVRCWRCELRWSPGAIELAAVKSVTCSACYAGIPQIAGVQLQFISASRDKVAKEMERLGNDFAAVDLPIQFKIVSER